MLSIGLDPWFIIERAFGRGVPSEFRTVLISVSDVALLIPLIYGVLSRLHDSDDAHPTAEVIAWSGVVLTGCLVLSAFVAGVPWLSLARSAKVALGLVVCLTVAHRRSPTMRLLVGGPGMIVLQLSQVILQEMSQISRSLGPLIPGCRRTPARATRHSVRHPPAGVT